MAGRRACLCAWVDRVVCVQTTGLVGLAVNPQARTALVDVYQKTLTVLGEMPASAEYRQATEKLTRFRLGVVQAETDPAAIERCGVWGMCTARGVQLTRSGG
jgi:hypothetical protein